MATSTGKLNHMRKADKNQGIRDIESVHLKTILCWVLFFIYSISLHSNNEDQFFVKNFHEIRSYTAFSIF
jgi:hypothetical protein